jgi:acetyl esterase
MNPKRHPKTAVALIVLLLLIGYSYRWTYTPYGRLDYPAALSLHLLTFPYTHKPDPQSDFKVRLQINLLYIISSMLPQETVGKVKDIVIPGPGVELPARVFWPVDPVDAQSAPLIVYFHGGGFVVGSVNIFDPLTRSLANTTKAIVISVDYRLAPAHPYPAAVDDGYAAVVWAVQNAASLGGDPSRIAVAGDSAGGNLAATVSLKARDMGGPAIAAQIMYYPAVDLTNAHYGSKEKFADGYGLSTESNAAFERAYVGHVQDKTDPYISPLYAKDLTRLPPALVFTAGFDPLTDAAKLYIDKLERNGIPVTAYHYPNIVHGFMSIRLFSERRDALNKTNQFLLAIYKGAHPISAQ